MATNKNKVIVYPDWIDIFNELTDEEAGKLIKHFFEYVNDNDPKLDDKYLKLAFAPIKSALKRDLKKWECIVEKRKKAGQKGGKQKAANVANANTSKQNVANLADKDNDNVNVNDSVNVNDIDISLKKKQSIFSFKKSLNELGADQELISDWLKVRAKKKATNTKTAFNAFRRELENSGMDINEVLTLCIERDWKGFKSEWITKMDNNGETDEQYAKRIAKEIE